MPSTGTITIDGKTYTWESPTIGQLASFEQTTQMPMHDLATVTSTRGRVYLASLCFQKHHPELTPGIINDWPGEALDQLWDMVLEAIPLISRWFQVSRPPAAPPANDQAGQTSSTSLSSPGSSDGPPASPEISQ